MGYNPNCIDASLADVTTSPHYLDHDDGMDWDFYIDDDWYNDEPEDDRDAYFDGIDVDAEDPEELPPVDEHDPYEIVLPHHRSLNVAHQRSRYCCKRCKRRFARPDNSKPKRKNHRG